MKAEEKRRGTRSKSGRASLSRFEAPNRKSRLTASRTDTEFSSTGSSTSHGNILLIQSEIRVQVPIVLRSRRRRRFPRSVSVPVPVRCSPSSPTETSSSESTVAFLTSSKIREVVVFIRVVEEGVLVVIFSVDLDDLDDVSWEAVNLCSYQRRAKVAC